MSWFYGQTWLWYLIAFLVGVLLAWLLLVLPQQRRIRAAQARTPVPVGGAPAEPAATPERSAPASSAPESTAPESAVPADESGSDPHPTPTDEVRTEQLPAVDPALSSLDAGRVPGRAGAGTAALAALGDTPDAGPDTGPDAPYGPGSARPTADGSAPDADHPIKGNVGSMLYHPPESPYFARTRAQVWFRSPQDAEAAGFARWDRRRSTSPQSVTVPQTSAPAFAAGPYPDSALPAADGSAPSPAYSIKGSAGSRRYHGPDSPYFRRTRAAVWFASADAAEAAGFTPWRRR